MVTVARQRSIQRVAQPVQRQTHDDQEQAETIASRPPISSPCASHRKQAKHGQMVRIDPGWRACCQPDECAFFQASKKTLLYALGLAKVGGLGCLFCRL